MSTASSAAVSGAFSLCPASARPHTVRAYSSRACWKPPQVPRKGMPSSRAVRMAASAPASLRYGLPGSTQTASNPSMPSVASCVGIQ